MKINRQFCPVHADYERRRKHWKILIVTILDKDDYLGCLGKSPYSNPLLGLTQICHLNMSMNTSSPSQGQTAAGIPDISLYLRGLLLRKIYGSLFWNSRILPCIGK